MQKHTTGAATGAGALAAQNNGPEATEPKHETQHDARSQQQLHQTVIASGEQGANNANKGEMMLTMNDVVIHNRLGSCSDSDISISTRSSYSSDGSSFTDESSGDESDANSLHFSDTNSKHQRNPSSTSVEGVAVSFPEVRPEHFPSVEEYNNRKEDPEKYPPDAASAGAGAGTRAGADDASATLYRDYFKPRGSFADLLGGRRRRSDASRILKPLPQGNARIDDAMAMAEESGNMGIQYVNMKLELATLSQELDETRLKLQRKATQHSQLQEYAKQMEEQEALSVESFLQMKKSSDEAQVSLKEIQGKTTRDLFLSQTVAKHTEKRLGTVTKERDVSLEQLQEGVAERSDLDMKLKDATRVIQMMKHQSKSSSMERNDMLKQVERAKFDQTQIQMVAQNRANAVTQLEVQVKQLKTELKEEKLQRGAAEREPARFSDFSARNNSGNHQDDTASPGAQTSTSARRIEFSWIANVLFPPSRHRRVSDSTRVKRSASENDLNIDAAANDCSRKSFKMRGRVASYENLIQEFDSPTAKGKSKKKFQQRGSLSSTKSSNPFQNMSRSIHSRYSGSTRSDICVAPGLFGNNWSINTDLNQQDRGDQEEVTECEDGSNSEVQQVPLRCKQRPNYLLDTIVRSAMLPFHRNKKNNSSRHDHGDTNLRLSTSSSDDDLECESEDYTNVDATTQARAQASASNGIAAGTTERLPLHPAPVIQEARGDCDAGESKQ
jgi:hypothetical protein